MIHRLTIERFRGIRELTLRDLGRVNLIVGENNSGKSTVLDAIGTALTRNPYALPRPHHKLKGWPGSGPLARRMRLAFNDAQEEAIIVTMLVDFLSAGQGELKVAVLVEEGEFPEGVTVFPEEREGGGFFSPFETPLEVVLDVEVRLSNEEGIKASLTYPLIRGNNTVAIRRFGLQDFPEFPAYAGLDTDQIPAEQTASLVSNLTRSGQISVLQQVLVEMEPELERLVVLTSDSFAGDKPTVEVMRRGSTITFPLASMGEGFARAVDVIGTLASVPEGVCTVDEIENGIHYSAQADLWRAVRTVIEKTEAQLWATTHSYECVHAAWEAFKDAPPGTLRVHRLERQPDGSHRTRTMDEETLPILFQNEAEIR